MSHRARREILFLAKLIEICAGQVNAYLDSTLDDRHESCVENAARDLIRISESLRVSVDAEVFELRTERRQSGAACRVEYDTYNCRLSGTRCQAPIQPLKSKND